MKRITIGQQHYQWTVKAFPWLNAIECTIYNIVDPVQCLIIVQNGNDPSLCTPQQVKVWINFALQEKWYRATRIYRLFEIKGHIRMVRLAHSLTAEATVMEKLSQKFNKKTTALEKSAIKHQFTILEQNIGLILPSVLKQLYLFLGNGDFGPDYGFFLLEGEEQVNKITLSEAYQTLHAAGIKDWDWKLSELFVPILYWGADIYSMIDCSSPDGAIYVFDENLKKTDTTWQTCVWEHCSSLLEWLEKWSAGDVSGRSLWLEMYQLKGLL